jgi:hyaluronan synthase
VSTRVSPAAERSSSPRPDPSPSPHAPWALPVVTAGAVAAIACFIVARRILQPVLYAALERATLDQSWAYLVTRPSLLWVYMGMTLVCLRTCFWLRYRPVPALAPIEAPFLTVIIPAYNEGQMVARSIDSAATAHYPNERLEIFVVDDGSTDDTWEHIQLAAARHPNLVTALRFPRNSGKRAALEAGFRKARGEVLVTVDSDSVIDPRALLAIAAPFRDPQVGAVAGKVDVLNRSQGLIPRMLQVRYFFSFDLLRAAQSVYGTVYCCPGALTAYRSSVVREVLDGWVAQTFLGVRCTYGEDRAMTNFILAAGYDTVYQRNAVVRTVVPWTYRKLCKMYLRWDRSYVREEIRFARIVWSRPLDKLWIAAFETFVTNLRYPIGYACLGLAAVLIRHDPVIFPRMLLAIGVMSLLNMLYYLYMERSREFVYGVLYAYFSVFTLFWIFPYAALTVRSRSWMTR